MQGLVLFSFTPLLPEGCLFWWSYSWFRPVYMNLLSERGKLMLLIKNTLLPTHQHQSLDMLLVIEKGNTVRVSSPQLYLASHYQNFSTITSNLWILLSSQSLGKAIYPHFTDQSHKRIQKLGRKGDLNPNIILKTSLHSCFPKSLKVPVLRTWKSHIPADFFLALKDLSLVRG